MSLDEGRAGYWKDRAELLQERVNQLEALLGVGLKAPPQWRLTGRMETILGVLLARDVATVDACMAAMYRDVGKDEASVNNIYVQMVRLRRSLRPHGVEVHTLHGRGFYLERETKERLRVLLGQAAQAPA